LLFEPELVMKAIERERAELLFGVPTMQIAILQHPARPQRDLSSLKVAISGGAPVPPELLKRIEAGLGCELLAVYGQTEASPIICQTGADDTTEDKAETAGRPLPQVEVKIVDLALGKTCAYDVEGEIQARGYQTMLGYFEMDEATARTLTDEGWLRTGDLGTMDDRGYVRITGRLKDMIIRGGENIYPAEVEARLLEHPMVTDAVVFGCPDDTWGEIVCAALQFQADAEVPSADALKTHCRAAIAPNKVPARWYRCDAFPMTGSGKVQKFRMREEAAAGRLDPLS
jgi:fatty-acyl-CoA synthase/long-chain acyl-CoA synthetase